MNPAVVSGLPALPVDHPLSLSGQLGMTIGTTAVALGFYVFAVRTARRERSIWPVVVMLSSTLCLLAEPVYDANYRVGFYDRGEIWGLYTAYGMTQPIWVPITYLWVYGGLALLVHRQLAGGGSGRDLWRTFATVFAVFTAFEVIGINLGTYEYYGPHPFRLLDFPVWLSVMNTGVSVVAGVAVFRLVPLLKGAQVWSLLVVLPASFAMMEFLAFPALTVINSDDPPMALVYLAALAAMAMTLTVLWLVLKAVPDRREPAVSATPVPSERNSAI